VIPLYLYNDLHFGDQCFTRPLYRAILASGAVDLAIGVFRNHLPLVEDLAEEGATILVSDYEDRGPSPIFSLRHECPPDRIPISTWLGEYEDTREHQWRNVVEVFLRQCRERRIENPVHFELEPTPMIDFRPRPLEPSVPARTVYLDDSETRSGHSAFRFDLERLARRFPDLYFLCTAEPGLKAPNILDGSRFDLRDLSSLSNACLAILGKGSGPFCCTYTEVNRFKPRAVCGYRSRTSPTFWDYEGNPLLYLDTMDEVEAFLERVHRGGFRRTAARPPGTPSPAEVPA